MEIPAAQRELCSVYIGNFPGRLVSSIVWFLSTDIAAETWISPNTRIYVLIITGFFIFPLTQLTLRLVGRPASLSPHNSFRKLAMQVAHWLRRNLFGCSCYEPGRSASAGIAP